MNKADKWLRAMVAVLFLTIIFGWFQMSKMEQQIHMYSTVLSETVGVDMYAFKAVNAQIRRDYAKSLSYFYDCESYSWTIPGHRLLEEPISEGDIPMDYDDDCGNSMSIPMVNWIPPKSSGND